MVGRKRVVRRRPMVGGRKRVIRRRPMVGGKRRSGRGLWDTIRSSLSSANDFLRDNRLISRGLSMIPGKYSKPLAALASTAGYGRKRRGGMMLRPPPFMGGRMRRVGGRVVFPAVYTTGLGGLSATTA